MLDGGIKRQTLPGPRLQQNQDGYKIINKDGSVDIIDYAIVEQNNDSCLDLDQRELSDTSQLGKSSIMSATNKQSEYKNHQKPIDSQLIRASLDGKKVPVTNIDFREAKQYNRQRSGVENPSTKVTYKLPSYASCLRAKIRPKNFTALKQYYELLAKDEKLAMINQKHLLSKIDRDSSP